jgi:rhamnopyranosyl-N-acetylglucosaminyl-diphospho-decaprenol beta-1,3/1,4-galactofuranosyltransferase
MTVAAAILTHNRLELLKKSVCSLRNQTRKPDDIIVVDNGSTDGTAEWLASQNDLFVVTQPNSGSAGGFFSAMKSGYERKHDWVFCLDDDVIPLEDALEKLTSNRYFLSSNTGFLCCRVVNPELRTYMTPRPIDPFPKWYDTIGESLCVRVGNANFAGFMVGREAMRRFGLPIREFFIWEEDREYSERIARKMPCYCVLDSVVVHYQGKMGGNFRLKKLYQARNKFTRVIIADISLYKKVYFKSLFYIQIHRMACGQHPLSEISLKVFVLGFLGIVSV